jgi:hypothetical protein
MYYVRFLGIALTVLLVIALLFGGAAVIQRAAWSQGYAMGRLATSGDGSAVTPYLPYGYPAPFYGSASSMGGLGLIFTFGLVFLLFLALGLLFRPRRWGMPNGPWVREHMSPGGPQAGPWQRPPWCWSAGKQPEQTPAKPEADVQAADAEAQ